MKTYTGVRYCKRDKKYKAKVTHKNIIYNCGSHDTPQAAVRARDIKILEKNIPAKLQVLKRVKDET